MASPSLPPISASLIERCNRTKFDFGVKLRARLLTTVPDSTSLSFILLGTLTRKSSDKGSNGERHVVVHIDFGALNKRKCQENDMERWYARTLGGQPDCLMGHKVSTSSTFDIELIRSHSNGSCVANSCLTA